MKKLTPIRTLTICKNLWTWLSKYPRKSKYDWPEWKKLTIKYDVFLHSCPCCEYQEQEAEYKGERCQENKCLLSGYAWGKLPYNCEESTKSPFYKWFYLDKRIPVSNPRYSTLRTKYALQIVAACDKALADLRKNSNRLLSSKYTS